MLIRLTLRMSSQNSDGQTSTYLASYITSVSPTFLISKIKLFLSHMVKVRTLGCGLSHGEGPGSLWVS